MSAARVAAAILAGGQGRRMGGINKAFLAVEGRPIIERQLAVLRPLFDHVVVVTADAAAFRRARDSHRDPNDTVIPGAPDLEVIEDRHGPALGPLAGLDAALGWLPAGCESLVCVAGDMPFLAPPLLAYLRDAPPAQAPAVVPRLGRQSQRQPEPQPQPLCARYHRALGTVVQAQLAGGGTRAMHLFLEQVARASQSSNPVVWIDEAQLRGFDPDLATFTNVNTPADLPRPPE